jgi:biopolymer transport protein ExbB/TolQ
MTENIYAALMIGGVGLFVGVFLGFASKVFAVKVNQKENQHQKISQQLKRNQIQVILILIQNQRMIKMDNSKTLVY